MAAVERIDAKARANISADTFVPVVLFGCLALVLYLRPAGLFPAKGR